MMIFNCDFLQRADNINICIKRETSIITKSYGWHRPCNSKGITAPLVPQKRITMKKIIAIFVLALTIAGGAYALNLATEGKASQAYACGSHYC